MASNATDSPQRNALLLRVETQAGHGGGKPMAKHIADATDKWSFCMAAAGAGSAGAAETGLFTATGASGLAVSTAGAGCAAASA